MLRVSKLADYACVIMQFMAQDKAISPSAAFIAEHTGIALPTVRKLLKQLTGASLLISSRGVGGGYSMANSADNLSLINIIEAVDGPIGITDCCTEKGCRIMHSCKTKESWQNINAVIVDALKSKTLADLSHEGA